MKPRQSIKTTAKKIGSFQKEIGRDPNRSNVDVKPYGGYTPLSHKIEAGANIEQNYSVNVQNQMQLMKKISEVSTLNTNHMHMQLGHLEKELKQWEKKINEAVKKKNSSIRPDVIQLAPTRTSNLQLTTLKKGLYNSRMSQLNKLSVHESTSASYLLKSLMNHSLTNQSNNQNTFAVEQFNQSIKTLQHNVKEVLDQQWQVLNNQLLSMVTTVENKNNLSLASLEAFVDRLETSSKLDLETIKELKAYYQNQFESTEAVENKEALIETSLEHIQSQLETSSKVKIETLKEQKENFQKEIQSSRTLENSNNLSETFKEHIENNLITSSERLSSTSDEKESFLLKTDTFIERLQWLVETTMEAHLEKLIESEIKEWFQENNLSSVIVDQELMSEVKDNLKTFYKTFEQREWIKELILAESPMVLETLYEGVVQLYDYMDGDTYDTKTLSEKKTVQVFNTLIKSLSTETINRTARYKGKKENNETNLIECFESLSTFDLLEEKYTNEQKQQIDHFIESQLSHSDQTSHNNFESTEKTIQWIGGLFKLKDHLASKSILESQKSIGKKYYDTLCIESIESQNEGVKQHYSSIERIQNQELTKWRSWYETLSKVYGQSGFGMMRIKQHPIYQKLSYMQQPIEDEYLVTMLEQLSSYMEQFTSRVKLLENHIDDTSLISSRGVTFQLDKIHQLIQAFESHQKYSLKNHIESKQEDYIKAYLKIVKTVFDRNKTTYDLKRINQIVKHHDQLKQILKYQELEKENNQVISSKEVIKTLESQSIEPAELRMPQSAQLTFQQQIENYQELMMPVREMVVETFRELQRSMNDRHDSQNFNRIDGYHIQRYFQSFQREIQKLSQKSQHMLQMKPHMMNQKLLTYYSQLLMKNESIDKVSEQFINNLVKNDTSSAFYKNLEKTLNQKTVLNKTFATSLSENTKNSLMSQLLNTRSNKSIQKNWLTQYITQGPQLTFGHSSHFNESFAESLNKVFKEGNYRNPLLTMTNTLQMHNAVESLFNAINARASYTQKQSLSKMKGTWSERIVKRVKNFYEKRMEEIHQKHNISYTTGDDIYSMNYNTQSENSIRTNKPNIYQSVINNLQHNKAEVNENNYMESKNLNPYQETLMAYTTEIVQESSDELQQQVVSQQELIELIQKEISQLKEEKNETEVNVERISQAVLKEITHKLRKDRQRKGWI